MDEDKRKKQLLELFATITSKTKIVEPMKKIHGSLRDRDAIEREIALIMREILDKGYFKTKLTPRQLARLVMAFYDNKNDTEIARSLGDEKLSKTVARARVRMKLFRDLDFKMPFDREKLGGAHRVREDHEGGERGARHLPVDPSRVPPCPRRGGRSHPGPLPPAHPGCDGGP